LAADVYAIVHSTGENYGLLSSDSELEAAENSIRNGGVVESL